MKLAQHADDMVSSLFWMEAVTSLSKLTKILSTYSKISGDKINHGKSEVMGINIKDSLKYQINKLTQAK